MPLSHEKQSSSLLRGSAWYPWRAWSFVTGHVVESFGDLSHSRKELQKAVNSEVSQAQQGKP